MLAIIEVFMNREIFGLHLIKNEKSTAIAVLEFLGDGHGTASYGISLIT